MALQHLRSSTAHKRAVAANLADGQFAINTNIASPGVYFKDSNGTLVKAGPIHIGTSAPNFTPAGSTGNSVGESWVDITGGGFIFKVWDGTSWLSSEAQYINASGDVMTGAFVIGNTGSLVFEGSTDDGFETTLAVVNPTADQTITLPNITGTVITSGDTGTVTSTMILDGTIANGDINASAGIVDTKLATISTADKVSLSAVNIDGATDIGSALADADLFVVDDNASGTNRKAAATRITDYTFAKISGDITVTSVGAATLASVGVASTYTKVTTDAKGRVTSGTTLAAADIPTLTASKISDFDTQVRTSRLDQMAAPTTSLSLNSQKITGLATPTADTDAATKAYVDALKQGLDIKDSVRIATTANITLSGLQTIDGISLAANDRVLVKNQSTGSQNGIYLVSASSWTRTLDANASSKVTPGMFVFVEGGASNADSGWVLTTDGTITLDTTSLTFAQFSGAGQITAGAGLTKTGNTIDIATASAARIVVNADSIDLASGVVTAGTYRSVTVDSYGRVTAGTSPTTLSGYGITDALPLSGGTMTGAITTPNGAVGIVIGDDSRFADRNVANTAFLEGAQNNDRGYINFSSTTGNALGAVNGGDLTWRGSSIITAANYNSYAPTLTGTGASGNWSINVTGNSATTSGCTFSNDAADKDNITTRTESGFYQTSTGTIAEGWPTDSNGYHHLISCTHNNDANNYAMQIAARFDTQNWYFRNLNNSGTQSWSIMLHSGNYNLYSPTLTGTGASGTWGINVTGAASLNVLKAGDLMTGALGITAGSAAAPSLYISGDTNTGIYSPAADQLAVATNGTERLRITAAGLVGIGTSNPAYLLDVNGQIRGIANNNALLASNGSGSGQTSIGLRREGGATDQKTWEIFTGASGEFKIRTINDTYTGGEDAFVINRGSGFSVNSVQLHTNGSERLRIDSSGRLLVGTSTSIAAGSATNANLQVNAPTGQISAAFYGTTDSSFGSTFVLGHGRVMPSGLLVDGDTLGQIRFAGGDGNDLTSLGAQITAVVDGTPGLDDMPGRLVFSTTADGASSPTERLRITSAGNVGIGTTSPVGRLNIAYGTGGAAVNDGLYLTESDSSGIYTSSLRFNGILTHLYGGRSGGELRLENNGTGVVTAYTNGTERARIDSSGRLLVGTSASRTSRINLNVFNAPLQIESDVEGAQAITRWSADISGSRLHLQKGRGTIAAPTSVASGDSLADITFSGFEGTNMTNGARIEALVDGTPGANDMPGRLVFSTTADGASTPTERMRITSLGRVQVTGAYDENVTAVPALNINCSSGNYFTKTISADSTFTVSDVPASRAYAFTLELTHTSGTVTWFANIQWPGGAAAPTLTTGKTHLFVFVTDDGGARWRASSLINYTN